MLPKPTVPTGPAGPAVAATGRDRPAWRWTVLSVWLAAWTAVHLPRPAGSWHYFVTGAHALTTAGRAGGVHLYHAHPQLQIGPLSFVVALPFTLAGRAAGTVLAVLAMSAVGLALLVVLSRLVPVTERARLLVPGLAVIPVWEELAGRAGHLDDVLALAGGVLALAALRRRRPLAAAVLLGLAVDAKPWAVGFVAVLLVVPGSAARARALLTWTLVVAAAWAPFALADPGTVTAAAYRIPVAADSALRALGSTAALTPAWCRAAQAALGLALAVAAVRAGRPAAVPLVVVAARMLLDPSTSSYYTAGLVLTAAVVDLLVVRGPRDRPWCTAAAVALVYVPGYLHVAALADADVRGDLRALTLAGLVVAALALPRRAGSRVDLPRPVALAA